MLSRFVLAMTSMFCSHEWVRRRDSRRVYLECVRCLSTTPGIEYGRTQLGVTPALPKTLEVVRA
jgi:hypothetical protein